MQPQSSERLEPRRARREAEVRRRRLVLLVSVPVAATLAVVVALLLAGRGPASTTGAVASPIPAPTLTGAPGDRLPDVVLARVGRLQLMLPIERGQVTAVLFHPADQPGVVPLTPDDRVEHVVAPPDGRAGPDTAAVDVGAPATSIVFSPVDGVVVSVTPYLVAGRQEGYELAIAPSALGGVLVRMTHLEKPGGLPRPRVGRSVTAGQTVVGQVRDFSRVAEQELAQYTSDAGNHVRLEVVRVPVSDP